MLLPDWLRSSACAFLYWIVFLLALEPGNVLHAQSMGHTLDFDDEALRIGVAALLGCSTAPLILALSRRFPFSGSRGWRSIAIHAAGAATLSFALIVISCVLAAWMLMGTDRSLTGRRPQSAGRQLVATDICAVRIRRDQPCDEFGSRGEPSRLPLPSRQLPSRRGDAWAYLDLDSIEWIESQGNYLALHAGGRSHLIRETLAEFRQPARSGPVHPRSSARDRGRRSDTRNPAARERRLDIDTARRPYASRQSQLSRDRQEADGPHDH